LSAGDLFMAVHPRRAATGADAPRRPMDDGMIRIQGTLRGRKHARLLTRHTHWQRIGGSPTAAFLSETGDIPQHGLETELRCKHAA
jgi:hypothetical protein